MGFFDRLLDEDLAVVCKGESKRLSRRFFTLVMPTEEPAFAA
jgi:hypothetical protein